MTRRDYLQLVAAGAAATATTRTLLAVGGDADRAQRMQWWHEARFGMFIHWGLYSRSTAATNGPWSRKAGRSRNTKSSPSSSSPSPSRARLGPTRQGRRTEVHGDDHQAPRRLLPLRQQADRLHVRQTGSRPRPRPGVRRCRPRRGDARRLLLFADGLAPSRRRPLRYRRSGAQAFRRLHLTGRSANC